MTRTKRALLLAFAKSTQEQALRDLADATWKEATAWADRHRLSVEYDDGMGVRMFYVWNPRRRWSVYWDKVETDHGRHPHAAYVKYADRPKLLAFLSPLIDLLDLDGDLEEYGLSLCLMGGRKYTPAAGRQKKKTKKTAVSTRRPGPRPPPGRPTARPEPRRP